MTGPRFRRSKWSDLRCATDVTHVLALTANEPLPGALQSRTSVRLSPTASSTQLLLGPL